MRQFTLNVGDRLVIGDSIKITNLPKRDEYMTCQSAKLGISAPKDVTIIRANNKNGKVIHPFPAKL